MKTFHQYMTESIDVAGAKNSTNVIKDVISKCLITTVGIHLEHWKTFNEARHEALGEFYINLNEQLDSLAEIALGIGIDLRSDFAFTHTFTTQEDFIDFLPGLRDRVNQALNVTSTTELQSINDCLVAIQKSIDTLAYKLELL
jgi:hypothetical protein